MQWKEEGKEASDLDCNGQQLTGSLPGCNVVLDSHPAVLRIVWTRLEMIIMLG